MPPRGILKGLGWIYLIMISGSLIIFGPFVLEVRITIVFTNFLCLVLRIADRNQAVLPRF